MQTPQQATAAQIAMGQRLNIAVQVLHYCQTMEASGGGPAGRELAADELALRWAATEVLRNFLRGEFGAEIDLDEPPASPPALPVQS